MPAVPDYKGGLVSVILALDKRGSSTLKTVPETWSDLTEMLPQGWPHLFGQKLAGLKWDLADDGFYPFPYAARCMSGRCSK
jgi:hypothetical protein